jgi:hypothetical protein
MASNRPIWIKARYPGRCTRCGQAIKRGDEVLYYTVGRKLLCNGDDCGRQAMRDFEAAEADERLYRMGYGV